MIQATTNYKSVAPKGVALSVLWPIAKHRGEAAGIYKIGCNFLHPFCPQRRRLARQGEIKKLPMEPYPLG